jgi:hypothetical protein
MPLIVVDVEADGSIPNMYSMVCFGAIVVDRNLDKTFYGETKPISINHVPDALKVSGFTREQHMRFEDPLVTMSNFTKWIKKVCEYEENGVIKYDRPVFISDNLAFDWQWINYYFHYFIGTNPFGHSGRRIGDLYCGMLMDGSKNHEWKRKYRKTRHSHNPLDDSRGNAEAILSMIDLGLKLKL